MKKFTLISAIIVSAFSLSSCDNGQNNRAQAPDFLVGDLIRSHYDGKADDLLTGGLGVAGLQSQVPPIFKDADKPTPAELRTYAIYTNYRALSDVTTAGGFGRLYGPNVGNDNKDGKIAGTEYLSFMKLDSRHQNVTLMIQIPDDFDAETPCLITAPSSGSRGIYGAIGTVGEW
ncbi:MAG: D-(-)-3-hydroxybutyrate oligomer hydrolase, partial [Alphaproteobacteria bacterium]|nr:D-(-)-3-hydroxybutyrate oligomer hydrolase [Alphaproteobacteria bacterium]